MAQKNAFIIDEDRELALTVAAALRADGFKVSISEGDRDPLDEIRAERPDIVLVRAESSGKESGYTLVSRVKRNKRTQATPVFLYTSDQNLQMIETHKTKDTRADDYLVLPPQPPYPLDELRERVRNILFPPGGMDRPPPLPPQPKEDLKPVTHEDSAFIEKVMDSLQSSRELEEAPSAAALKAGGSQLARRTTADAKLDMLREKLRQRESDLARVMEMYRAKEREYHQFHERLVEKDVEAQSLKMTIDELAAQLEITKEELERRTNEFNASFELLLEEKVNRENELIQVVAAKEKELQDQRSEMWDAERTAKVRIDALESTLADLDLEKHKLEQDIFVLRETIAEREGAIEALRQELDDAAQRQRDLEQVRDGQVTKILGHEDRMLRLEETILELRSDLSAEREAADLDHEELTRSLDAKEALVDGLRSDLTDVEDSLRNLDAQLHGEIADLEAKLDGRERALSQTLDAKADVERILAETQASWAANKDDLETQLAEKTSELDAERIARAASEDALTADLSAAEARIEALTAEKERKEIELERLESELRGTIRAKEDAIDELDRTLKALRAQAASTEASMRADLDRLESARMSLELTLAEREEELAAKVAELEALVAARDASLAERGAELEALRTELQDHRDRIASLEAELADEAERFRELEAESEAHHGRMTADLARLESELAKTRGEAEALEGELRDQIIQLGIDLAAKGDEADTLGRELEVERRERSYAERSASSLSETLASTRADLDDTQRTLRGVERDLGTLRETLAQREGRLSELQEALSDEKEERQAKESELGRLRSDYDLRAAELGRLEGKIAILDDNLGGLRREREDLSNNLAVTRAELAMQSASLATARAEASERGSRLEEAARTLKQREDELAKSRDQISDLLSERERLGKEHEALRADRDRGNHENLRLENRITELGIELEGFRERAGELEAEVDSRGGRIEVLSHALTTAEESRNDLDRARVALTGDLARAEEALVRLQGELDRARAEWVESRAALTKERDAVRARMAELGRELDETREQRDQALHARAIHEEQASARAKMDAQAQASLSKEIESLKTQRELREEEIAAELENRDAHVRSLDREIAATREELESQRLAHERAVRDIETLERNLSGAREEVEQIGHTSALEKQQLQSSVDVLGIDLAALRTTHDEMKSSFEAQVASLTQHVDGLERTITTERDARDKERDRARAEAVALAERLEEASSRGAALGAERRSVEERRVAEITERDRQIAELMRMLDERKNEGVRQQQDFSERMAQMQGELAKLRDVVEDGKREREEVETRYLREFEEAQENFIRQTKDKEGAHAREVEELRAQKLEITRQLRTSQLAAQRLTDRVQKLETERPAPKSGAEEEFDSFLRQLDPPLRRDAGADPTKLPIPSAVPGPAGARPMPSMPRPAPTGAGTKPASSAAALAASRVAAIQARRSATAESAPLTSAPSPSSPSSSSAFGGAGTNPLMAQAAAPEHVDATVPMTLGLDAPAGLAEPRPEPPIESEATVVGPISLEAPQPPKPGVPRRPLPPPRKPVPSTVAKPRSASDLLTPASDLGAPSAPKAASDGAPPASDDFLAAFEREFEDLKKT